MRNGFGFGFGCHSYTFFLVEYGTSTTLDSTFSDMGIKDMFDKKKEKLKDIISSTTQKVNPAKISRFATKLAENAATYALQEGYKHLPGGSVVVDIVSKTLHDMKSDDHKGPVEKVSNYGGKQEHNIAEEGLKDHPENSEKDDMKQENKVTIHRDKRLKPLKESSDETIKSSDEANKKRDSIRSRL